MWKDLSKNMYERKSVKCAYDAIHVWVLRTDDYSGI